jgi:hypothetical protein
MRRSCSAEITETHDPAKLSYANPAVEAADSEVLQGSMVLFRNDFISLINVVDSPF